MKMIKKLFFISFYIILFPSLVWANNLYISNATLEDRDAAGGTAVVQFNISWDHSWRKNDGRKDAAWVFLKIYKNTTAPWIHGLLKTAGTNPVDTSLGSNGDVEVVIPSDKMGAFIQRKSSGNGTFSSSKVRLTVDLTSSGVSSTDTIQVKVFGVEMVYIPTGPFYIGDGNGQNESTYALHLNGADNTSVQITTAGKSITTDSNSADDIDTSPVTVTGGAGITANSSWPNGYNAFYLMKYLIVQGQYVDFLNTLNRTQQRRRVLENVANDTVTNYYVMSSTTSPTTAADRNGIRAPASGNGTSPTTVVFGCDLNENGTFNEAGDGQFVAMDDITTMDLMAYADWAALRPITELEYEKAARGTNSSAYGEYAWGTTKITEATAPIVNSGLSNEVASNTGEGLANIHATGSFVAGPLRSGFSATSSTNRQSAGAGYYGNMDLTGNMMITVVSLGHTVGRNFTGTHGDGTLTTTASFEGNATNNDWPGINATTARGISGATGTGSRGNQWYVATYSGMSDRSSMSFSSSRQAYYSGLLGRTAP